MANEDIQRTSDNTARVQRDYEVTTNRLSQAIHAAVEKLSNWNLEDDGAGDIHAVRTTSIFRFKDDITITVSEVEGGSRLTADSASRVGKSDLGQNPKNLEELMDHIDDELDRPISG